MFKRIKQSLCITFSLLATFPAHLALAQNAPAGAQANPDIDTRRPIVTRPNERTHILANMRMYLVGLQKLTEAIGREDMEAAAVAARSMGTINLYEVHLMFANAAAIDFRNHAFEVQRDFDAIAKDTEEKQDSKLLLRQLGVVMKKCVRCHDTYKLQDTAH